MNKKTSGTKVAMPKNLDEANAFLAEVGQIDRGLARAKANLEASVARLRTQTIEAITPDVARRKLVASGIARFAKKNRIAILPVDRKSVELPAGVIGWRLDPMKVVVSGGDEKVIKWLEANEGARFLRPQVELNREQLLEEKPKNIPGVRFAQDERFYIEPKQELEPEVGRTVVPLSRAA